MNPGPLSGGQAKAQLNRCLEEGSVIYTSHFKEELRSDNLSIEDVLAVCRSGLISMAPEEHIKSGQWRYRIEGITTDRQTVAAVFCLRSDLTVFITVFKKHP